MPYSTKGKNNMLDGIGATYVSAHTGIPDNTGSNEATGGSPAYARKSVTFSAASSGSKAASNAPVMDVAAGTYSYVGLWDASTSGNFLGYAPINGGTVKGVGNAVASTDVVTSYAHGLATNDRVALYGVNNAAIPTGLSASTLYYVIGATTDTFQVSTSLGGSAVDITANGEVGFQKTIPETFASQGTITASTTTLDLLG